MIPPLVSFVAWNRLGLTARNLTALLATRDDFELYIIDNNSTDNSWDFIQDLRDERIKLRKRFELNRGPVYASNYNLSRRKREQYFITVDSDVNIHTPDWVSVFLNAFSVFPEVGLLGAVSKEYYDRYNQTIIRKEERGIYYLQLVRGFVEGCCQCLRPELLDILGYWSEESCMGDAEICSRICTGTSYKAGFLPAVAIDQLQHVNCNECAAQKWCGLDRGKKTCFDIRNEKYSNPRFRTVNGWKHNKCIKEMEQGRRPVFCPSVHDAESRKAVLYNSSMAEENFRFYELHGN